MIFNELKALANPILEKIYRQPFNTELASGKLPMEKFVFYLHQDALYLADFSRALALMGTRLSKPAHFKRFIEFSLGAIAAEQDLHENYLSRYSDKKFGDVEKSPACLMYTSFIMQSVTTGSVETALAALLPCFWIYTEVGQHIVKSNEGVKDNPYQQWIDLYSSEEFAQATDLAVATLEDLYTHTAKPDLTAIIPSFMASTRLEWMFWDSAYRLEQWAV